VAEWREFEPLRAGVRTTISDILYADLPEPIYSQTDCEAKKLEVYNFVYEHYRDANTLLNA
jgi:MoaA/NifB/PqqE/SkfB family radical SAM enzyme